MKIVELLFPRKRKAEETTEKTLLFDMVHKDILEFNNTLRRLAEKRKRRIKRNVNALTTVKGKLR